MVNLQCLLRPTDHAIVDNGYHIQHASLRAPKAPPEFEETKLKVSVLSLTWRRYISFLRQQQERINVWCKKYKFCRTAIETWDIPHVQMVWNIACVDLVKSDTILMKDNVQNQKMAERIMDMRGVSLNYASWYWRWLPSKRNKVAKKKKSKAKAKSKRPEPFREFDSEWEVDADEVDDSHNHNRNRLEEETEEEQEEEKEEEKKEEEAVSECAEFETFLERRKAGKVRRRS